MRERQRPAPELRSARTGLTHVDELSILPEPTLEMYVAAASQYVREARVLDRGAAKRAQIALSGALARALRHALIIRLPGVQVRAGERNVAGALRVAQADVSEAHELDGLRLAVEIKPVNLAVGRALWNRFGDVRAFAVNIHLKFPFAVVGGVLTVPTYEEKQSQAGPGSTIEQQQSDGSADEVEEAEVAEELAQAARAGSGLTRTSTLPLIERAVRRFERTRRRETEADAPHLLEAVSVVVYDPDSASVHPLPRPGRGLRWEEFIDHLVEAYELRFE